MGDEPRQQVTAPTQAEDPNDPMALRPDDAWIGRWWWWGRLYQRNRGETRQLFRWPLMTVMAVVLVILIGLAYVLLTGHQP